MIREYSHHMLKSRSVDTREVWEGGVLGLLLSGDGSGADEDYVVRRASTFYTAMLSVRAPQRHRGYPPILKLPVANARKRLHAPLSDLDPHYLKLLDASDGCDLKKDYVDAHQPLTEHIDAVEKIRSDRSLSFSIAKERARGLMTRFIETKHESATGRTILQACPFEGARSTGEIRPPTGVLIRLDRCSTGAEKVEATDAVLVGRPAWRKALADVRMPKFGEFNVSIAEMLSEPAASMSSEKELKDVTVKDIVDSVFDSTGLDNVRDFVRFIACGHINPDLWDAVSKKITDNSASSDDTKDLPDDGVRADPVWTVIQGDYLSGLNALNGLNELLNSVPIPKPPKIKGGAEEKETPPTGCDLDTLPDRPMESWIRDPSPEAPGDPPEAHETKAMKQHGVRTRFWDEYRSAVSTTGSEVLIGISQGHLRLAGPVMLAKKNADGDSLDRLVYPTYDHIRAVEPRGACRTFHAKALQSLAASQEKAFEEVMSNAEEDVTRIAGTNRAWASLISDSKIRRRDRVRGSIKNAVFDSLEYRDDELELGIDDVFHYREVKQVVDEGNGSFLQEPDAPSKLLREMAYLLGVSPPLDVTEERTILDELEYHLPGGEGEQARILRKRIDDVKRRRNELMAKAGVGGRAYEAVENRLIDRLRKDSTVKIISETVVYIAILLSNTVGDRIAESPSGALRSCLELPANAKRAIGAAKVIKAKRGRRVGGMGGGEGGGEGGMAGTGGGEAAIDLLSLLSCAGTTVIGTRCPPDAPPPPEASSVEIAKRIVAIKATMGDVMVSSEGKTQRKAKDDRGIHHFKPLPELHKNNTGSIAALWSHVRSSQVSVEGVLINPVSSCCSYDSELSGIWTSIKVPPAGDIQLAYTIGIQPAKDLPIVTTFLNKNKLSSPTFVPVRIPDTFMVDPIVQEADIVEGVEVEEDMSVLLEADPTLSSELVPPGGLAALSQENKMRLDNLMGNDNDENVRNLLHPNGTQRAPEEAESARILSAFLRSELAPALRKMSSPEITALLSADADIAKCSSELRDPETRSRLSQLADACSAASHAETVMVLSSVVTFALWATSTMGKDLPQKSAEASKHAAAILLRRLSGRLEISRSDHLEEDTVKVKAIKEALRAANRAALEKLTDTDRELLGELNMAIRGMPDASEMTVEADGAEAEDSVEEVEEKRSDEEMVEDARDAFF